MNPQLPMPADFAARADGVPNRTLMAHYGVSLGVIGRWRREAGVRPASGGKGRPFVTAAMPDGFALVAPTMTIKQLRERYGRCKTVIERWLAEAGVTARKPLDRHIGNYPLQLTKRVHRDESRAGLAAEFLRRFGPVYRCRSTGEASIGGSHWNRGGFVLTGDELIYRAERLGWNPEAWRMVA